MSEKPRPDKLSLVVFSGEIDKAHYALVMASCAAATNMPATLFFTNEACRTLTPPDAAAAAREAEWQALGVAGFEELLEACVQMGVRFMVCEMGLRALGLAREDLRDDVPLEVGGVVSFLNDASKDGSMLFI